MKNSFFTVLIFSAALGFTYLSTVPPTAALVGKMFGSSYLATLFGPIIWWFGLPRGQARQVNNWAELFGGSNNRTDFLDLAMAK